jgi:hypothetical protein
MPSSAIMFFQSDAVPNACSGTEKTIGNTVRSGRDTAVQTDDYPKDERRKAILVIIVGLALGIMTWVGAHLFTCEGMGPGPHDEEGRAAVIASILIGFLLTIALIVAGVATYWV